MDDATRAALSRERIDLLATMVQELRAKLSDAETDNARLRAALEKIADMPIQHATCLDNQMRAIARAALEDAP